MLQPPSLQVAIIGAGPAGCYLAQALTKAVTNCEITVFDRNVAPYGLIRSGVAADHQHTKAITRQFERVFQQPNVRFAGNLTIGHPADGADLSANQLFENFDAVVFATGLFDDLALPIDGADTPGVVGAGQIIRTLNSAPGASPTLPSLGEDVVIFGLGNVALDVLRFLVKDADGYANSDISDTAVEQYLSSPAQRITVVSRSGPASLKADAAMITELAKLPRANYATPDEIPEPDAQNRVAASRLTALNLLLTNDRPTAPGPQVTLRFGAIAERVSGDERVSSVEVNTANGIERIPATAVITAIGFGADPLTSSLASEYTEHPHVYRTGWARRGPNGAIPENRTCAKSVADTIASDYAAHTLTHDPAKLGFTGLPAASQQKSVSFSQWQQLDTHELKNARPNRVRHKLSDHETMLSIATAAPGTSTTK